MLFTFVFTLSADDLKSYKNRQRVSIDSLRNEGKKGEELAKKGRDEFMMVEKAGYETWKKLEKRQLMEYKKEIEAKWGSFLISSKKSWVEYSSDQLSVGVVDFERGVITVEVLRRPSESPKEAVSRLSKAVERVLESHGTRSLVPEQNDEMWPALDQPVLENQVQDCSGKKIDSSSAPVFSMEVAENALRQNQKSIDSKIVVYIPLSSDHNFQRAKKYHAVVNKYCIEYKLDYSHVMATIHAESLFNPMARSSSNGIGLMQLVPEQGGREAFKFVYGYDNIPLSDMLYNPERNIQLGCAYIYLLKNRYFGAVFNGRSNLYCSIAGYNTGPGNVAFAFTGKNNIDLAVGKINEVDNSDSVYNMLLGHLPFYETRSYLRNVTETMKLYKLKDSSSYEGGAQ